MLHALLYLRLRSLQNLVWSRLRRLRQPKYLVGALFAIAYFYLLVFRRARAGMSAAGGGLLTQLSPDTAALVLGFGGVALLVLVCGMWVLPGDRPGFHFSEPEIAFLFPAPVTRSALVHYKLVSTLFSSLLQTLFFAVIFNGRAVLTGRAPQLLVSWWLVLSFISLHYLGASLTIARLVERGIHARTRRAAVLGLVVLVIAVAAAWIWRTLPPPPAAGPGAEWLRQPFATGALRWVLWPVQLLLRPFLAASFGAFLLALAPALAVLTLHYLWITRTNVAFEEASIARAERRAARLAELRRSGGVRVSAAPARGRRPPFNVGRAPWPELAFVWKNLLSARPWFTPRAWLAVAGILVAASAILQQAMGNAYWRAGGMIAAAGMVTIFAALFYGPLLSRLDLRQDLPNADILKGYPLPGWRVVLGELLAPTAVLSGIVWLGLLAWYLGLHGHQPPSLSPEWFSPGMRVVWCLCAAVIAPAVLAVELLIPNAAPVLLPGWFHSLRTPGGGIDLMGQRLIFGFGQVFVVALSLAVALGFAVGSHLMIRGAFAVWALVARVESAGPGPAVSITFGAAVTALALLGELLAGVWWVGRRFERLDVSETHA